MEKRSLLVTGANGFIGKNLCSRMAELGGFEVVKFNRNDDVTRLENAIREADVVVHLAGVNRSNEDTRFEDVNIGLTSILCEAISNKYVNTGNPTKIIFASSTHVKGKSAYGRSKLEAEEIIQLITKRVPLTANIMRLPGVFGKWCKPNYNSVVATWCDSVINDVPINIDDPDKEISLVHIDDVIKRILSCFKFSNPGYFFRRVSPVYRITLGELARRIIEFNKARSLFSVGKVGVGFDRLLYSTYVSYLPLERARISIPFFEDRRGVFAEVLRTTDSGQVSFFTIRRGESRGGHYHHNKTEKFLVVSGLARFRFRDMLTNELVTFEVDAKFPTVVDTIPGWIHDIFNIGQCELVVLLWANELFDSAAPDTFRLSV